MKAFLFDMDGVVVDSESVFLGQLQDYLAGKGVQVEREALQWQIGLSDTQIAREIVERYDVGITVEECEAEKDEHFGNVYLTSTELCPLEGLVDFLCELRRRGARTALVSSTGCSGILKVLNRFDLVSRFDAIVGGDMVQNRKPHPEPYLMGAGFLGLDPADCVVVEDSPPGIGAGVAAGMHVVGLTAAAVKQDVSAAHETAGSYAELIARLDEWLPIK